MSYLRLSKVYDRSVTFNVLGLMGNDFFFWEEDVIRKNEIERIIIDHWILIDKYRINNDGSINVEGNVKFSENMNFLKELPLKFNKVSGDFDCSKLSLESLKGSPIEVGGKFNCSYNKLQTLEFLPKKVGCFVFDNTVKSSFTDRLNCDFGEVILLHITDMADQIFLQEIDSKSLKIFFKLQNYYGIWNDDKTLNKEAFTEFLKDLREGLE